MNILSLAQANPKLVLMTDFGLKDGAVSAMKGVIDQIDENIIVSDLSHEIPAFNIWEASYRLMQTVPYWKSGTVFVSVVDPGVGTDRRSVVAKLSSGQLIVTPDNGTLTHLAEKLGIESIRLIDEKKYRRKGSQDSPTFDGRDLYAQMGALLASGKKTFKDVGPKLNAPITISYAKGTWDEGTLIGNIPVIDPQYGNLWTNIPLDLTQKLAMKVGENFRVQILNKKEIVYNRLVPYAKTFGSVSEGEDLLYINSLLCVSLAINQGNFAKTRGVESGADWTIKISRP